MAAEHYLIAMACAAGMVEGASVLLHRAKEEHDGDSSSSKPVASLVFPSILYGTAALPLSLVGASPGPVMLSKLDPLVNKWPSLPLRVPLQQSSALSADPQKNNANDEHERGKPNSKNWASLAARFTSQDEKEEKEPIRRMKLQTVAEPFKKAAIEVPDELSSAEAAAAGQWGRDAVARFRQQNKRAAAAMRAQKEKEKSIRNSKPASHIISSPQISSSGPWHRYLATMDGRPLPTPLAEAMRRSRVILVTAGLVCGLVSYRMANMEAAKEEALAKRKRRLEGRDAEAVNAFVGDSNGGVIVRLVGGDYSSMERVFTDRSRSSDESAVANKETGHSPKVLPVVCMDTSTDYGQRELIERRVVDQGKNWAYWRLQKSSNDMEKIPLSERWFFRQAGKDIAPILLVETDITVPLRSYLAKTGNGRSLDRWNRVMSKLDNIIYPHDNISVLPPLSLSRVRSVSRELRTLARKKGLADSAESVVNVVVTSGLSKPKASEEATEILIDGVTDVAYAIESSLEWLWEARLGVSDGPAGLPLRRDSVREDYVYVNGAEKDRVDHAAQSGPIISFFESVGTNVRHSLERFIGSVAVLIKDSSSRNTSTREAPAKVLHVFSDDRSFGRWLRSFLTPRGWKIAWHDSTDPECELVIESLSPDCLVMAYCQSDEETAELFCSIRSRLPGKVLALVEDRSTMKQGMNDEESASIISVAEIHRGLFSRARQLLVQGKPVEETQRLLNRYPS